MTKILQFFNPTQKYGGFSNLADIPCEVRGQKFPNVQKAVYSFVLGDYPSKDKLLLIENYYDLHQNYKHSKAQKYLHDLYIGTQKAYAARLKSDPVQISSSQRFISYRPDHLLDQRSKYVIGQDAHNYGYNMVGHVLQKMYHPQYFEDDNFKMAVYMAYRACLLMITRLKNGQNITQFRGWLPVQILEKLGKTIDSEDVPFSEIQNIYTQFRNHVLTHQYYVQQEMLYPRSLIFFILKREAPFINFHIHDVIQEKLLYNACAYVITKDYEVSHKFVPNTFLAQNSKLSYEKSNEYKDRLLSLYATNRLPLKPSVMEDIQTLMSNRVSDNFVEEAINFIPLNIVPDFPGKNPETYMLVLTDNPDQPLSPTSECKFTMDGYTFYTVLHAIYYHMFSTILPKDEAYCLLLKNKKKSKHVEMKDFLPVLTTSFDAIYEQLLLNFTVTILREALLYKFKENPLLQQLLFQTEKDGYTGFLYEDPSDPIIGYDPKLTVLYGNSMNWTGKIILEIRSLLNPELKEEYNFFWDRVHDNIYLHAWLKKRMMDMRLSLSWFKDITPLTMKSIRLFFTKLYSPYHVIYRHVKSTFENSNKPEPYFISFFENLQMGDDVLQYVYDHFTAMFIGVLQDNDNSLDKLYDKIKEGVEDTTHLTVENGKTILEKILLLLNYLPKKYNKQTLSLLLSIIQGSDTLIKIPDKTFVMFYENNPTYIYISTYFLPILKSIPGFTHANIGDVGYVATYLLNHLSTTRFHFFFT